jgi:sulfonate transport system permease protein
MTSVAEVAIRPDDIIVEGLRRRERRFQRRDQVAAVATPLALLLIWEVAARAEWIDARLFPAPSTIFVAMYDMTLDGSLLTHLLSTILRIVYGSVIGITVGVAVGLAMGYYRLVGAAFSPILSALYALPKIAIFPLLLVIFGLGETPRVLVVAISVFFIMQISAMSGVRHVDPRIIEAGKAFGAGGSRLFRHVVLPAVMPSIFAGLRVASGVAILVIVAVEFVGSNNGLGFLIWNAWTLFQPTRMYVGLTVVALLGAVLAGLVTGAERLATPWSRVSRRRGRRQASPDAS